MPPLLKTAYFEIINRRPPRATLPHFPYRPFKQGVARGGRQAFANAVGDLRPLGYALTPEGVGLASAPVPLSQPITRYTYLALVRLSAYVFAVLSKCEPPSITSVASCLIIPPIFKNRGCSASDPRADGRGGRGSPRLSLLVPRCSALVR